MVTRPDIWKDVKIIKINTPKLKKFLGVPESEKYISFSEAFGEKMIIYLQKSQKKLFLQNQLKEELMRKIL